MSTLFRIILLEPKESLNIGSVARAMMNFGFTELAIVRPTHFDRERAATTARRAVSLVDGALRYESLSESVAACTEVIGFSTKDSKNTPPVQILSDWADSILARPGAPSNTKIGLLFGPEDTGLRYEHLPTCNSLVRIPSFDEYDSLNLAQAVMLVLYELCRKNRDFSVSESEPRAVGEQFDALDRLIHEVASQAKFINEGTPEHTVGLLKNLFRRPNLTEREAQILLGFFSRISKTIPKRR